MCLWILYLVLMTCDLCYWCCFHFRSILSRISLVVVAAGLKENNTPISEREQAATDELTLVIKRSILAKMKGEFDQAEQLCHEALAMLVPLRREKVFSAEKLLQVTVYVYDVMANLALARGEMDKAEKMFKETLKGLLQQGMQQDANAVVDISLKLAMIYASQGNDEQAGQGYKFCIDTQKKKISGGGLDESTEEDTKALLGLAMDCYSRFLLSREHYTEAEEFLTNALVVAQSVFDENDTQMAALYSDLANVKSLLGKNDAALSNIKTALDIAKKSDSSIEAVLHCNLGNICLSRGEAKQAQTHCAKALKLAKKLKYKEVILQANECLKEAKEMKK